MTHAHIPLSRAKFVLPLMLSALLAVASSPAVADTVTVAPPHPDSNTQITLQIAGISPNSQPIKLRTFSISAQTVHIEGCIGAGFATPSSYQFAIEIGTLEPGSYTAEYYAATCDSKGNLLGSLNLRATQVFAVNPTAIATPTLQPGTLFVLVVLVALSAVALSRQRTRT